ncbi:uncharacterized protein LOC135952551 [Calliphora vicina]|uniref:uncharacterized protein LOC135952551 n=1 Tax=Calliphora vicina TaxID=7373 RepID=UPI00325BE505
MTPKAEIEDTPSPEWIKYQQERFQNIYKLPETLTNKPQPKEPVVVAASNKVHSKMETTSRHEGAHHKEDEQEQAKHAEFESNNAEHTEDFMKDSMTGNAVEFPSIQGFIEFIKSLRQNWMKNSIFRIDDKIKMLHQLKDTLLKTIEQQFMVLWQDDNDEENAEDHGHEITNSDSRKMGENKRSSHLRSKRGILDESSINFPPHAALMSINFLTFAVFLIKLVLQVVNIIRTKHYQLSSMDTGAIRNG